MIKIEKRIEAIYVYELKYDTQEYELMASLPPDCVPYIYNDRFAIALDNKIYFNANNKNVIYIDKTFELENE